MLPPSHLYPDGFFKPDEFSLNFQFGLNADFFSQPGHKASQEKAIHSQNPGLSADFGLSVGFGLNADFCFFASDHNADLGLSGDCGYNS